MDIETRKAMMRSKRVPDVMLALYRAVRMSDHAEIDDMPWSVRGYYQLVAEQAIEELLLKERHRATDTATGGAAWK